MVVYGLYQALTALVISTLSNLTGMRMSLMFDFAAESYGVDETEEIPVEVQTGTLVVFNGYLLHRSRKNRSQTYRRVLVNHYCNAWSLLPWHLAEGEHVASADRRGVVPVSGVDPYAWKGYDPVSDNVWLRCCKTVDETNAS